MKEGIFFLGKAKDCTKMQLIIEVHKILLLSVKKKMKRKKNENKNIKKKKNSS